MPEKDPLGDPRQADDKLQAQLLVHRWLLTAFYVVLTLTGVIDADPVWFVASAAFLVIYHACYTWYVFQGVTRPALPPEACYVVPFLDTAGVSLALIAVGDPQHPIWGAYFFVAVGVAFFYRRLIWYFSAWLALNYAMIVVTLAFRDVEPDVPDMIVASVILTMAMLVLATFTTEERRVRGRIAVAARTDPLTGAQNRRGLEESLNEYIAAARAAHQTFATLMIDVDHFKRYNDQYGHLRADGILEQLTEMFTGLLPKEHLVARYGGDEFVVLVPGIAPADALRLAERVRSDVAESGLCTVSIGLCTFESGESSGAELLNQADAALLEAKRAGRDCVRAAPSGERVAA
jgi:diguanylate cyclase (GGDEF)-like protein